MTIARLRDYSQAAGRDLKCEYDLNALGKTKDLKTRILQAILPGCVDEDIRSARCKPGLGVESRMHARL